MNFFSYFLKKVTCTDKVKRYFLFFSLNAESSSCNQLLCILVEFSLISTNKSNTTNSSEMFINLRVNIHTQQREDYKQFLFIKCYLLPQTLF